MTARDLLLSKRLPGNVLDQQAASRRALAELANREISVPQLSGIATDFGIINAGTIVMGNGLPLGAGFTGMMRFADALEWPAGSGNFWTDIAFSSDVMTFGISALDGKLYAAAGALTVDQVGINTNGLNYFWNMQAAFNANTNYARTGMFIPYDAYGGSPQPAWQTTYQTSAGSDLAVNGGFETGDFTGWATSGTGAWSVWAAPAPVSGTYVARLSTSGGQTGTLSQTGRIAVSPLSPYEFVAWVAFAGGAPAWSSSGQTIQIDFYDNTVGGNLLDSFTYTLPFATSGAFSKFWKILTSPASAAAVQITINLARAAGLGAFSALVDAVSVKNIQSYSQISMQPELTVDGSGVQLEELQENTSTAHPAFQDPPPGFGHLYMRRKTHALALFRSFAEAPLDIPAGEILRHVHYANTTSVDVYTRTIRAGSLGANGNLWFEIALQVSNTTGSTRTCPISVVLDGTTVMTFSPGNLPTGNVATYRMVVVMNNSSNAASQGYEVYVMYRHPDSTSGLGTATVQMGAFSSAKNTGLNDVDFVIHCAPSVASSSLSIERTFAMMVGPNYAP